MKKFLLLSLTSLLIMFCLAGCGNHVTEVPNSVIEVTCDTCEPFCDFSDYYSTTLGTVTHNVDKDANTDYVSYEFGFDYGCGSCVYYCENCYQYYKDSDTWSCISSTEPEFIRVDWNKDSIIGLYEDNSDWNLLKKHDVNYAWEVEIQDFDYESNCITVCYNINCDMALNKGYDYYNSGSDTLDTFNWSDTEDFSFDTNESGDIQVDIPCGVIINNKSYDICLRVQVRPTGIWTGIIGW